MIKAAFLFYVLIPATTLLTFHPIFYDTWTHPQSVGPKILRDESRILKVDFWREISPLVKIGYFFNEKKKKKTQKIVDKISFYFWKQLFEQPRTIHRFRQTKRSWGESWMG